VKHFNFQKLRWFKFMVCSRGSPLEIVHSTPPLISFVELTCGIHVRFQIRDVPGPKTASLPEFDTYASDSTTVIFVLDVTVKRDDMLDFRCLYVVSSILGRLFRFNQSPSSLCAMDVLKWSSCSIRSSDSQGLFSSETRRH
jgi:hypothetical protein